MILAASLYIALENRPRFWAPTIAGLYPTFQTMINVVPRRSRALPPPAHNQGTPKITGGIFAVERVANLHILLTHARTNRRWTRGNASVSKTDTKQNALRCLQIDQEMMTIKVVGGG